jgi:predicted ATP-dependent serine protease
MVEEVASKKSEAFEYRETSKEIPESIAEVEISDEKRIFSEIEEFDRILGGGLVLGSVVLIGGAPGIYTAFAIGKQVQQKRYQSALCKRGRIYQAD